MTRIGVLRWLRRRDPGHQVLRRGLRLSVVAAAGLFGGTYGLADPVLGLYTLFAAIATGLISKLPGGPVQRIRALLTVLPVALALVTVGSLLAVNTWAAAAGMLVVGFTVAFATAGGPRILGLATGLQLFYIAASFPPYAPGSLPSRLGGVALGIGLLVVAERVLWPEPGPPEYRDRLAGATSTMAHYLDVVARLPAGEPPHGAELADCQAAARGAVAGLALAGFPPTERPASADARDRAIRRAATLLAQLLVQADRLRDTGTDVWAHGADARGGSGTDVGASDVDVRGGSGTDVRGGSGTDAGASGADVRGGSGADVRGGELARLLRRAAEVTHAAAATLAGGAAPVGEPELAELEAQIRHGYDHPPVERDDAARVPDLLRVVAVTLRLADHARLLGLTTRIVAGLGPPAPSWGELGPDDFRYARRRRLSLYWEQVRLHLTTRSVYLQGALRVAVALAIARVVAGFLHLNHGFWVLLAILTLMRTTAVDTSRALRPVLLGTLVGAGVGTLLLTAAHLPDLTLVALPVLMVLTFAIGPLLPAIWAQALFTVLFVLVFIAVGPANLAIAGARLLDVAIGAVVGILAGLLLWPKGGSGEMRRSVARYLETSASAAERVVQRLAGRELDVDVDATVRQRVLAEASLLQYQSERHDRWLPPVDWTAAVAAANYLHLGVLFRLGRGAAGRLTRVAGAADRLEEYAGRVRHGYLELVSQLHAGDGRRRVSVPAPPEDFADQVRAVLDAGESPSTALNLVDVEVWLSGAAEHLDRVHGAGPDTPGRSRDE